ncbi:MAG TPA: elongation factor 1-beta [Candidatus Thermoplasmatota archaeon]|nr:elongation factor 1-beta [Candidatus Thermoplasmatota archaeon]
MGKLVAVFRVMPEDADVDLETIKAGVKASVPKDAELQGWQVVPVAFGLKALEVTVVMEDESGAGPDGVELAFSEIAGVGSVQMTDVGRI